MSRIPRLIVGMALLSVLVGHSRGEPGGKPQAETRPVERVEVRGDGGRRQVEGVVLVEAVDGGLLLERADERLELVQPGVILSRTPVARPEVESPRDLGRRILGELPPGFDLLVTKHYCICFDTSRAYAQWCAALFERLHDAFANFWKQAGIEMTP
jgi:hypothetical protein